MQELLNVNERYHELLVATEMQRTELDRANAELAELRPALESAHAKLAAQQEALVRADAVAKDATTAHGLQTARCSAAEAERDELHKVVKAYAQRLLEVETRLGDTQQRNAEAEAWLASHWEAGYEEGIKQQQREVKTKLHRAKERAASAAATAFQEGKAESSAAQSARITREQAERRLLLHRAEEARQQQQALAKRLGEERKQRQTAEGRSAALDARLRGVRSQKEALRDELSASRAAHAADLEHFDQMENALGLACAEYSSLAARHARAYSPPRSPPRPSERTSDEMHFGSSPPDSQRTQPPRPAAVQEELG